MSDFSVDARSDGDWVVVTAAGDIDVYTAPRLKRALTEEIDRGHHHIVLDMTQVKFMDSTGLAVMVGGLKKVKAKHGTLELAGPNDQIRRILTITDLVKILPVHDSVEDACRGKTP